MFAFFLSYNLKFRVNIFLCLGKLSRSGTYILSFTFSMSWNISECSFNVKFFCQHHILRDILSATSIFLIYVRQVHLHFTVVLHIPGLWKAKVSTFPGLWSFSCIQRKFQHYHYLYFHLLASPLFWLFCSVSRGFVYY